MHSAEVLIGGLNVPLADLTDLNLTLAEAQGATGQLTFTGTAEPTASSITLIHKFKGLETRRETYAVTPEFGGATDAHKSRVRRVTLNDLTDRLRTPLPGGRGELGLPLPPSRYQPVVYDINKPLGSDLPTNEECEEKARSGSFSNVSAVQRALTAAGLDLLIIPGPGLVTSAVDDTYSAGADVGAVLNELLLTNGVSYWLEDDVLVVDGRALPPGPLELPPEDANAAVIDLSEERPEPEREPQLADYLARCIENIETEPGPGGSFELNPDGSITQTDVSGTQVGGGDYERTVSKVTKSGGRVVRESEDAWGYLTTPSGRTIGRTYSRSLTNEHHPQVPAALIGSVEETYTYADYGLLQNELGEGQGNSELLKELWPRFQAQSPYVSKRTVKTQRWNAEGLLRHVTTSTREFSGLMTEETPTGPTVRLLYKDSSENEDYLPIGGGTYRYKMTGVMLVDRPVYEAGEDGDGNATAEPTGIMTDRVPYTKIIPVMDGAPPSVSTSLPSCKEQDTCILEAQREYAEAKADYDARQINNAPRRSYTVQFVGRLRLGLKKGMDYGGCRVAEVRHGLGRQNMTSTVTLEHAI